MKLLYFIGTCILAATFSIEAKAVTSPFLLQKQEEKKAALDTVIKVGACEIKIINVANGKFGYEIYKNSKLLIRQVIIPAIPGNNGFSSKADAEKIARKIAEKINNGETLPSLSAIEVTNLVPLPKIKQ